MRWERQSIVLSCGCAGSGRWDDLYIGVDQHCTAHGAQTVARMGRIFEATPSKNFQLGLSETPAVEGVPEPTVDA